MSGPVRARMRMRATIQRNTEAGTDGLGHQLLPSWSNLATVACFVWSTMKKTGMNREVEAVLVEDWRGLFPVDADITERDRISNVKNRSQSETIFAGPFTVEAIQRKSDHLELALRQAD